MALNAYLTIKGAKQGLMKGSVIQKGRENQIAIYGFEHEVVSPRDSATGQSSGKRQHKPMLLTKELDKSTPLLFKALAQNENISEFTLRFYSPAILGSGGSGTEVQTYTIKLTNATIVSINTILENNKIEVNMRLPVLQQVSFAYQKIEWIWVDGGLSFLDTWDAEPI